MYPHQSTFSADYINARFITLIVFASIRIYAIWFEHIFLLADRETDVAKLECTVHFRLRIDVRTHGELGLCTAAPIMVDDWQNVTISW